MIVPEMGNKIHESHQRVVRSKKKNQIYCFDLAQIQEGIEKCTCAKFRTDNQKKPLMSHEIPDYPWSKVDINLFSLKVEDYMIFID